MPEKKPIGKITHYFDKISVAIIKFNKKVSVGEMIKFKGANTDFSQKIASMQFDHKDISSAMDFATKLPPLARPITRGYSFW